LKKDFKDLHDYWASKNVMINAALKDKGKAIDKKIQDIQDEIDNKKKEINGKSTDLTNATASYSNAQQALTTYQQTFDNITKIKIDLDQKIQTMKQFKTLIDQEEKNNKLANMYFYAKELEKSLDDTTIKAPADLTNDLNKAWIDLSTGKTDVREGKLSVDQITADLDAKQKALADLNQKREANILKAIEGLNQ
jgi:chromosome segregation ATPase